MEKYTVYANRVEELEKIFNRYAKRAEKIGLKASLKVGEKYLKQVQIWSYDEANHCFAKGDKMVVEVVDIEINFPEYKLGEYRVQAVIEHGENGNLVYPYNNFVVPSKYHNGKGICEHCRTNHFRKTTLLLTDKSGIIKQVGTTCVAEYTGVNEWDIVHAFTAVEDILAESDIERGEYTGSGANYVETQWFLEACIHLIHVKGYNKENKFDADKVKTNDITETDRKAAEKVLEYFANREYTDNFLNNIKVSLANTYTRPNNGFIAYAYMAYRKELEKEEKNRAKEIENASSEYYGNVGDKVTVEVTGKIVGSYTVSYSYYSCSEVLVYEFKDSSNHTFIWKSASAGLEMAEDGTFKGRIKGTIKEHSEYNGRKQTVLTRVKAVA